MIDNNSTDQTDEVINKFQDIRIKYYKISNYGIIAKSRNLGINLAKENGLLF